MQFYSHAPNHVQHTYEGHANIEKFKTVVRDHLTRSQLNRRQTFQAPGESTVKCPRRIDVRK